MTYIDDFGGTQINLLKFVYKYLDNPEIEMKLAEQQINDKSLIIVPIV